MNRNTSRQVFLAIMIIALVRVMVPPTVPAQQIPAQQIPAPLEPWKDWVLWGAPSADTPTPYNNGEQRIRVWPTQLNLQADATQGAWQVQVRVFEDSWVGVPGNDQNWPVEVRANGEPIPVIAREGVPSVQLKAGVHELTGEFRWSVMPQRIAIPKQIGVLSLVVNGAAVPVPNWDATGDVWLQRLRAPAAAKDLLTVQVYRVLEDGIPLWLRSEIELTVDGKSREEQIGFILPEGWQLSLVESPIPVAVDEQGMMKAQVRAGKWRVQVHAFRTTDLTALRFAPDTPPATAAELLGFRSKPDFRIAELTGVRSVDVNQTTFPQDWRDLPIFEWKTDASVSLVEKMRGMGLQRPRGLTIHRHFWLDDDGRGLTYRDSVKGELQQIWRLDIADGQQLGAVRVAGQPQLITANPVTGANGVEIRTRNLNMEAVGRATRTTTLPATGWQTNAESLQLSLSLPPGWRVFALFGADRVMGDWLTAWSLLDLFLLLIFSLAVFRLWGFRAGIVALLAFGLTYHEPVAPRLTWLFVLMPIALLRVVPEGAGHRWLIAWRNIAVGLLVLSLVPFAARQVQSAIYPQLESQGFSYGTRGMFQWLGAAYDTTSWVVSHAQEAPVNAPASSRLSSGKIAQTNLWFDPTTKVQTGPAVPHWRGNQVTCYWNSPVSSDQRIRPVLISRQMHRGLTVLRLVLLFMLAAIILGGWRWPLRWPRRSGAAMVGGATLMLAGLLSANTATAQIPDADMLNTLRQRLLERPNVFPHAAEIAAVEMTLNQGRISLRAEVHAAVDVAVPLPGRLPGWSPLTVTVDEQPNALVCRREDGYLWVTVPEGIHTVAVEGWLAETNEWEWTYLLKPRRVSITAPDWNVAGVRPHGAPDDHVLFTRREQPTEGEATYDQKHFRPVVVVDRQLEIGLLWKVDNRVSRLSSAGKAISLSVPLLPGERVLTPDVVVREGAVEVNLGANQENFQWVSELPAATDISLAAPQTGVSVERWHLVTSPIWNVAFEGLDPVYEATEANLVPVWHPWPGESVTLSFRRPEPVSGETVTVQKVSQETTLGARHRDTKLKLKVETSLGADFGIDLDPEASVASLTVDGERVPVRRDGRQLIVPLRPGKQSVEIDWTTSQPLAAVAAAEPVALPVDGANVSSILVVPRSRWILWAGGPLRGPAVRFWPILVTALLIALALSQFSLSPLSRLEWLLLGIGLTQVHVGAAMLVVGWLFLLAWRGQREPTQMGFFSFKLLQLALVFLTLIVLGIFIVIVGEGLLGDPEMFVVGNGSTQHYLNWYQPQTGSALPQPYVVTISVWFYRLLMLFWALWLALALLRWLQAGWVAFSHGGCWKWTAPEEPAPLAELVEPQEP